MLCLKYLILQVLLTDTYSKYYFFQDAVTPLSEAEAVDLVKTVFASATERDIYTVSLSDIHNLHNYHLTAGSNLMWMFLQGDKVEIVILNASGIRREYMDLRKD